MHLPLRDLYTAVFGNLPGREVGAACDRLDLYFHHQPMGSASLMIVITLRPLDLFLAATTDAERQLRDTQLAFDMRASGARSNEQHIIARMADTVAALQRENEHLREAITRQDHRRSRPTSLVATIGILALIAVAVLALNVWT